MKSYRGWRLSYSKTANRYTAKGNDVEGNPKTVTASSRVDIERKVDDYLAPITFSVVIVNGIPTRISSRERVAVNLISRKEYVEDKDTPLCCSPSSETYWSM